MIVRLITFFAISSTLVAPTLVLAKGGGMDGGGGGGIEAAFRLRGINLIGEVSKVPAANSLCDTSVMRFSLNHFDFQVLDQINPPKQKDPSGTDNVGWAQPGEVELNKAIWSQFTDPNTQNLPNGMNVDRLILHLIYEGTGAKCNDDSFHISDKILPLIGELVIPLSSEEKWTFPYLYLGRGVGNGDDKALQILPYDSNSAGNSSVVFCQNEVSSADPEEPNNCLILYVDSSHHIGRRATIIKDAYLVSQKNTGPKSWLIYLSLVQTESLALPDLKIGNLDQLSSSTINSPVQIIHETQFGTWSWAFPWKQN